MLNNSKMATTQHFFLYCGNVVHLATVDHQDLKLSSLDCPSALVYNDNLK